MREYEVPEEVLNWPVPPLAAKAIAEGRNPCEEKTERRRIGKDFFFWSCVTKRWEWSPGYLGKDSTYKRKERRTT